jgi:hypothetical protein
MADPLGENCFRKGSTAFQINAFLALRYPQSPTKVPKSAILEYPLQQLAIMFAYNAPRFHSQEKRQPAFGVPTNPWPNARGNSATIALGAVESITTHG